MNIMVNNYCNLRCSYCFASTEMYEKAEKQNMKEKDFFKVLTYLKRNGIREVRIIGGEPTIHPKFKEFLQIVTRDPWFESIFIFSNCTFSMEVLYEIMVAAKKKKVVVLPNYNEKEFLGKRGEVVEKNLKTLTKCGIVKTLGINIYSKDFNYSYAIKKAEELGIRQIRWSITTPNYKLSEDFDVKSYFRGFYGVLRGFLRECREKGIYAMLDCNTIPPCVFTEDEKRELLSYKEDLFDRTDCNVILDVNPQLEIFRCFGMSEGYHEKLKSKKTIGEVRDGMVEEFRGVEEILLLDECRECEIYEKQGRSCSCLVYRRGQKQK